MNIQILHQAHRLPAARAPVDRQQRAVPLLLRGPPPRAARQARERQIAEVCAAEAVRVTLVGAIAPDASVHTEIGAASATGADNGVGAGDSGDSDDALDMLVEATEEAALAAADRERGARLWTEAAAARLRNS